MDARVGETAAKLIEEHRLTADEYETLILERDEELADWLAGEALALRRLVYGNDVFVRGLIEFTNHCANDCLYCGIRASNTSCERYRLTAEEIVGCCDEGYALGFRTFVLQGGEDPHYTDARLCPIVAEIKSRHPDCAVTLSVGERSRASYEALFEAGADRYLLRHETADRAHYGMLHPRTMSYDNRMRCLRDLKDIGYQVGAGFMVGSPFQTPAHLAADLVFIGELEPDMCGIGPFVPHHATCFANEAGGTVELTCFMLSLIRLTLPAVNLPSTTALGTIDPNGREKGMMAGANVVMPNLSPVGVRKKYDLYDNKICTGEEAAECRGCLQQRMRRIGFDVVVDRGDARANPLRATED